MTLILDLQLITVAYPNVHSTDDGWRGPDSKRCRQSTGGATTSTEPVLRTGLEVESKATRNRVGVPEPSRAQTNLESHCRCPQKSC
ncbi:hypothetical protein GBAR_LOCUS16357, partial [Geodia barretti]